MSEHGDLIARLREASKNLYIEAGDNPNTWAQVMRHDAALLEEAADEIAYLANHPHRSE